MPRGPHPVVLFVACAAVVPAALSIGPPGCGGQWQDRPFVHEWPLVGLHEPLACDACHPASGSLGPVAAACEACHEPDRPPGHHVGQGCGDCHTPFGWGDVTGGVDHSFFPLTDAHALDCLACHAADTYAGLDPACSACHEDDRPAGHHVGEDCAGCHTPTTWTDGVAVDHDFLPLTGAHDLGCAACHTPGTYAGLDATCATCHAGDAPGGDHNRGEDCGFCHVATSWSDPTFDHDREFPIPHHGADTCAECHPARPDYTAMSCLDGCHPRGETDGHHEDEGGYSYDSAACYDCHADGRAP